MHYALQDATNQDSYVDLFCANKSMNCYIINYALNLSTYIFIAGNEDFTPLETNVSFTNPPESTIAEEDEIPSMMPSRKKRSTTMDSTTIEIIIETDGSLEFSETFGVSVDPSILDFYPNMTLPSVATFTITDIDGKLDCSRSMCGAPNSLSPIVLHSKIQHPCFFLLLSFVVVCLFVFVVCFFSS